MTEAQVLAEINLKQLYPGLDELSITALEGCIDSMFNDAERFDRDNLTVSAERSLTIASLLENELNRRVSERKAQARARSVARMVEETVAKSVPEAGI